MVLNGQFSNEAFSTRQSPRIACEGTCLCNSTYEYRIVQLIVDFDSPAPRLGRGNSSPARLESVWDRRARAEQREADYCEGDDPLRVAAIVH
jgi:hypothetical protein